LLVDIEDKLAQGVSPGEPLDGAAVFLSLVQGNYLGGDEWGTVNLVVEGSLQAAGTAEHPVVLTALSRGWQGLVLAGHSNTLENVYVEKAKTGITVQGSNNTFVDLNINSCDVGLAFAAGSKENRVERVAIDKVRTGILLAGAADIVDSVILGNGPNGPAGAGIQGSRSAETSRFYRALVAQFPYGLDLDATQLEVYDGTITKNGNGILVHNSQTTEGVHPAYTCPAMPRSTGPSQSAPAVPSSWGRDPVFVRCDIVGNAGYAVRVQAPELVVVEESNIRGNGRGIVVEADSVHPQSRIVRSNIHGNGEQAQVEAMHVNGSLDISQNYWAKISDPELSRSWQMSHSQSFDCRIMSYAGHCSERYSGCSPQGRDIYQCGPYPTCRDAYTSPSGCYCEGATVTATWQSPYRFTGFSPTPLPAGPERENLTQKVQEQRQQQGL
jgi:hypothetical protein